MVCGSDHHQRSCPVCVLAGDKIAIGVGNLAELIADGVERAAGERIHLVLERGPQLYAQFT